MTFSKNEEQNDDTRIGGVSRRTIVKSAAWSVPVIALAVSTPLAAASPTDIEVGAFRIDGTCGALGLGLLATGFSLTAGSAALPVGTGVTITSSGLANVGVFTATGGTADISLLSATSRQITLTSALPAGATLQLATTLSVSVLFTVSAVVTLPDGYVGTGAKTAGSTSGTLVLCSAN
jgi:hypothetical protein